MRIKKHLRNSSSQAGQTLIETMAGIFVLAMGITAVVGLASYSLNSASNVIKQVIGIGLARQGVEAVKNMRDTNWLQAQVDVNCFNFKNNEFAASCYRSWLDNSNGYLLTECDTGCVLSFNPTSTDDKLGSAATSGQMDIKFWHLGGPSSQYGYSLARKALTNGSTDFFYYPATLSSDPPSGFYRSLTITPETSPTPFNKDSDLPALRIVSRVWWGDPKCPTPSATVYPTTGNCRVTLETVLTNWKTN